MTTTTISVSHPGFAFEAAHFLAYADGRRDALHGHSWSVTYAVEGELDDDGLVVDFRRAVEVGRRLAEGLDHKTLLPAVSMYLCIPRPTDEIHVEHPRTGERLVFPKRDVVLLPLPAVSAETLAGYLAERFAADLNVPTVTAVTATVEEIHGFSASHRRALREG